MKVIIMTWLSLSPIDVYGTQHRLAPMHLCDLTCKLTSAVPLHPPHSLDRLDIFVLHTMTTMAEHVSFLLK